MMLVSILMSLASLGFACLPARPSDELPCPSPPVFKEADGDIMGATVISEDFVMTMDKGTTVCIRDGYTWLPASNDCGPGTPTLSCPNSKMIAVVGGMTYGGSYEGHTLSCAPNTGRWMLTNDKGMPSQIGSDTLYKCGTVMGCPDLALITFTGSAPPGTQEEMMDTTLMGEDTVVECSDSTADLYDMSDATKPKKVTGEISCKKDAGQFTYKGSPAQTMIFACYSGMITCKPPVIATNIYEYCPGFWTCNTIYFDNSDITKIRCNAPYKVAYQYGSSSIKDADQLECVNLEWINSDDKTPVPNPHVTCAHKKDTGCTALATYTGAIPAGMMSDGQVTIDTTGLACGGSIILELFDPSGVVIVDNQQAFTCNTQTSKWVHTNGYTLDMKDKVSCAEVDSSNGTLNDCEINVKNADGVLPVHMTDNLKCASGMITVTDGTTIITTAELKCVNSMLMYTLNGMEMLIAKGATVEC